MQAEAGVGWEVSLGDCLMGVPPKKLDLIYMDPPFSHESEDSYYGVGSTHEEYLSYMEARVSHLTRGLSDFNFVLHVNFRSSHYLKVLVDGVLGRGNFRNEIVWGWSGPSVAKRQLPRKHDVLLWWGVGDYAFNQPYQPYKEGFCFGSASSWGAGLADPKARKDALLSRGKPLEDWWVDIPALIRNESEKVGYATQKPAALLERVVSTLSREGGCVLDPMMGSGTTGVAALRCGRDFHGLDVSEEAFETAVARLKSAELPFWLRP